MSYELVRQLVTGHGFDLGRSRLSRFQRGVVFRNPAFEFNVKLFCLDDDLFCFYLGRNIGESVVDSISLPSTRLKIVGVLVRGFTQHQFRTLQGHPVVSDLAHDPIPRTGYGHIRSLERSVVCSCESLHGGPIAFPIRANPARQAAQKSPSNGPSSLEGIWWQLHSGFNDVLVISNSSDKNVSGAILLFDANGTKWSEPTALGPHQTERVAMSDLLQKAALSGSPGQRGHQSLASTARSVGRDFEAWPERGADRRRDECDLHPRRLRSETKASSNAGSRGRRNAAHIAKPNRTQGELAIAANVVRDLDGACGSRPEIGAGTDAALAHLDHNGHLRAVRSRRAEAGAKATASLRGAGCSGCSDRVPINGGQIENDFQNRVASC